MNKVSVLSAIFLLIVSVLAGCNDINDYSTNPNHRLSFSVDTLSFDTIFSSVGSMTRQFMIYNPNDEAMKIESVVLANAGKSGFRINVDGRKGDSFQGIDIWKKDSLYVSVEVTVNPNGTNQPLIVEDSILFYTNGLRQSVLLQAYGQDVHLMKGGVTYTEDTTLASDLPYLVYDSISVSEGATLTIEKGAIFYMHNNANLIVSGTLKAKGTQDEPVLFRGDRLDFIQANVLLPYDRTPGQWGGMYFNSTSFDNEFDYVIVRNGSSGLMFQESEPDKLKIDIRNSQITNMDKNLLIAINAHIEASNSEFSNSSGAIAALVGGKYRFTHCTLANYKVIGNIRDMNSPCLILANEVEVEKEKKFYALQQAWFENCIIDGSFSADSTRQYRGEISLYTNDEKPEGNDETFNYRFTSCFIKTARTRINNERFVNNLFVKSPTYLKTGDRENVYEYDFRLANESVGIGQADRSIAENYPVDRYGVNRLTSETGPSVGAYEYVYQEEKEK